MTRSAVLVFYLLCVSSPAAEKGPPKSARLVAHAEIETAHAGKIWFCVEARDPDRILIGYTSAHRRGLRKWLALTGTDVSVRSGGEYFWIHSLGHGTLRLKQDYLTRAFQPGSACEQVVDTAIARRDSPPKTLRLRR